MPLCVNHISFLLSPRGDVGRGVSNVLPTHHAPIGQYRSCDLLQPITTHLDVSGLKTHSKNGAVKTVTLHHEPCRVVTSCWLEDDAKVDVCRLDCVSASTP